MKKRDVCAFVCLIFSFLYTQSAWADASTEPTMRRVISPEQPAFFFHVDVWNEPDPQKIIDLIPEDIKPYVIFNLSLSSSASRNQYDGTLIADSWMKVLAANRVWAVIQPSSGGQDLMKSRRSENIYERYFKEYPNFLGWNYSEQFWNFGKVNDWGDTNDTWAERVALFVDILELCHQYGGYLLTSYNQPVWDHAYTLLAMMKDYPDFRNFVSNDPDHFIACEKYTQKQYMYDTESQCLGGYLGGYVGQYGIRFDDCHWYGNLSEEDNYIGGIDNLQKIPVSFPFIESCQAVPFIEHFMFEGQTVFDGPELIWRQCFYKDKATATADGYMQHNWSRFKAFDEITISIIRQILKGTVRIMPRAEVLDRTKFAILNDYTGNTQAARITPKTLHMGLYRPVNDCGPNTSSDEGLHSHWYFKSTGRYPAIPIVSQLYEDDAREKLTLMKISEFDSRFGNNVHGIDYTPGGTNNSSKKIDAKIAYWNEIFPENGVTGDLYASNEGNRWVIYNPYQYKETHDGTYSIFERNEEAVTGEIAFQYNTCDKIKITLQPYTAGVMQEFSDRLEIYLNNYREDKGGALQEDVIEIFGCTPSDVRVAIVDDNGNVFQDGGSAGENSRTIKVKHNGPVTITVTNCRGTNTERRTDIKEAVYVAPEAPVTYKGGTQYEAEVMQFKNVSVVRSNAFKSGSEYYNPGYYGQGFVEMGVRNGASLRASQIYAAEQGTYLMKVRYLSAGEASYKVSVNGKLAGMIALPGSSDWTTAEIQLPLKAAADNEITLTRMSGVTVAIDCISLDFVNDEYTDLPDDTTDNGDNKEDLEAIGEQVFGEDFSVGDGYIPTGWITSDNGEEHIPGQSYGSGMRVFEFTGGGDIHYGMYTRVSSGAGYLAYGYDAGHPLFLQPGKYRITYNLAAWKKEPYLRLEVLNADGLVVAETIDAAAPDLNGSKASSTEGATQVKMVFTVDKAGNYILRFSPVTNAGGTSGSWLETVVANVSLEVLKTSSGLEEVFDNKIPACFDVYLLSGQLYQKNARTTDALPSGVYIIDGRKVIIE